MQQGQQSATEIIETNKQLIIEYTSSDNEWKLDSDKSGFKLWVRKEPSSGLNMSRVQTTVNKPIDQVAAFFNDVTNFKKADTTMVEAKVLEQFDSDFCIGYFQNKGLPGMDSRDICFAQRKFVEGDRIVIVRGNMEHASAQVPKGFTRGKMVLAGFVMSKIDENTTQLVVVMCMDPAGSVPEFIKNKIAFKSKEKVELFKKYIESQ